MKNRATAARAVPTRPKNPVIYGRVSELLHRRIAEAAKASTRSISEELAVLASEALGHRDRFGKPSTRCLYEILCVAVAQAEERAKQQGVADWTTDLACRQQVALAVSFGFTEFVSPDPDDRALIAASLRGRIATAELGRRG